MNDELFLRFDEAGKCRVAARDKQIKYLGVNKQQSKTCLISRGGSRYLFYYYCNLNYWRGFVDVLNEYTSTIVPSIEVVTTSCDSVSMLL